MLSDASAKGERNGVLFRDLKGSPKECMKRAKPRAERSPETKDVSKAGETESLELLPGRTARRARDPIANAKYPLSTMLRLLNELVHRPHARIIWANGMEHPPKQRLHTTWPRLYGGNKRGQQQDHPTHIPQLALILVVWHARLELP